MSLDDRFHVRVYALNSHAELTPRALPRPACNGLGQLSLVPVGSPVTGRLTIIDFL